MTPTDTFQSSRPLRGATPVASRSALTREEFQSSRPLRGATSIRPSLASSRRLFQSSRPLRGATSAARKAAMPEALFQSSRPLRGATSTSCWRGPRWNHFNPRAPYGARPNRLFQPGEFGNFNPRAPYGARQQKCTKIACVFAITDKGQMLFPLSSAVCQDARSGSRRKQRRNPVRTVPKIPYACSSHYRIIGSSGRYVCLQPKCSILLSYFFPR